MSRGRPAPAPRAVAILNQKGGVGKTTVTLGLASAAAAARTKVLVVDLDPQASSTWVLGHDAERRRHRAWPMSWPAASSTRPIVTSPWSDRIDLVPGGPDTTAAIDGDGTTRLRAALAALPADRYEAIIVDCPPTLGGPTLTALTAARHALIVVDPSALGLRGIGSVADAVDGVWEGANPDLDLCGVVVNRVPAISVEAERRIDELGRIVGRSTIWKPPIPQRVIVNQALGERRPIHAYGSRAGDVVHAFDASGPSCGGSSRADLTAPSVTCGDAPQQALGRQQALGSGQTSISLRLPLPSNVRAERPSIRRVTPSPISSARHPWAEPGVGVAPDHGDQVGPRGEQRGVDPRVPGHLADPRRDQRHRRPLGPVELVDGVGHGRRIGRLAGGDGGEDVLADPPPAVALVDAPGLAQLLERRRLALGDAEDGEVGQHLADRRVASPRPPAPATPPPPGRRPATWPAATGRPSA